MLIVPPMQVEEVAQGQAQIHMDHSRREGNTEELWVPLQGTWDMVDTDRAPKGSERRGEIYISTMLAVCRQVKQGAYFCNSKYRYR